MKTRFLASLLPIVIAACTASDPNDHDQDHDQDLEAAASAIGTSIEIVHPTLGIFTRVTANGTGCLPGTWEPRWSTDGSRLIIRARQYTAYLDAGQAMSIKDCNFGVDLRSAAKQQYALTGISHLGWASMDKPGMSLKESFRHYFAGGTPSVEHAINVTGPHDAAYGEKPLVIAPAQQTWSACGSTIRLNVLTRVFARNNAQKTGYCYTNWEACDAETVNDISFGLVARSC